MGKFEYLASNHEELIKIKDDYKQKNIDLGFKNKHLQDMLKSQTASEELKTENNLLKEKIKMLIENSDQYEKKCVLIAEQSEKQLLKLKTELDVKNKEISDLILGNSDYKKQITGDLNLKY